MEPEVVPGPERCVVIGASGILAPLGAMLHPSWGRTVGISRGGRLDQGDWDERTALDTSDLAALATWVGSQRNDITVLIAYAPAVAPPGWQLLHGLATHLLVVAPSAWAAPGGPRSPWAGLDGLVVVQLGWVAAGARRRWHTPQEVSAAVARELLLGWSPRQVTFGEVSPWAARPQ